MDLEAKRRALMKLAQMESSGGKFREHPIVNDGVQAGTRSISSYGLMPNTVYEMAQHDKSFQSSPLGQQVLQTSGDPDQINKITEDPNNDQAAADALWEYNQRRLQKYVPPEQLENAGVFAHRRGVSGAINAYTEGKNLEDDPYVKEYRSQPDDQ